MEAFAAKSVVWKYQPRLFSRYGPSRLQIGGNLTEHPPPKIDRSYHAIQSHYHQRIPGGVAS